MTIKSKMVKIFYTFIMSILLIFSSCEGEDGDTGPQGAQGPAGNANVEAYTYTTNNSDWVSSNNGTMWTANLTATDITQEVVDGGSVQMFFGSSGGWVAMPFALYDVEYNYAYGLQSTEISVTSGTQLQINNPGGQSFKLVIIPPASLVKNMDYKNHEMLQALYGI